MERSNRLTVSSFNSNCLMSFYEMSLIMSYVCAAYVQCSSAAVHFSAPDDATDA